MNLLRWILAGGIALLAAAYVAFFILAGNFRKSFGASENGALWAVIPLLVAGALLWWIVPRSR